MYDGMMFLWDYILTFGMEVNLLYSLFFTLALIILVRADNSPVSGISMLVLDG